MNKQKRIDNYTSEVIRIRAYISDCLEQRKLFEQDKENYNPGNAPESCRELCSISFSNYKQGISATLCANVEFIGFDKESKLATMLGCGRDEPFQPYITNYLKEIKQ